MDKNLTWDDQIKHLENKLLATLDYCIDQTHQKVYTLFPILQNLSITICFTPYLCNFLGGIYPSKLQKLFSIQKQCLRIIFGETLSFDHSEYYLSCARTKTYDEHVTLKDYKLEHTKLLFNKKIVF